MISARGLLIQAGPGLYLPGCIVYVQVTELVPSSLLGMSETWGGVTYFNYYS